jgi:hypothetical protein
VKTFVAIIIVPVLYIIATAATVNIIVKIGKILANSDIYVFQDYLANLILIAWSGTILWVCVFFIRRLGNKL